MQRVNSFGARATLSSGGAPVDYFALGALERAGLTTLDSLPFSIRVLLENLLRNEDGELVSDADVRNLAGWNASDPLQTEVPYMPARVLLQDFTGVPAVVDLAAMRDAMKRLGGDPRRINPQIPVDLVVDHSVQVDSFGSTASFRTNSEHEFERNGERYVFLRWGQESFENFRVVPPETGICHQVNLEYLAQVVFRAQGNGSTLAFPDTLVGTDSHTTMINGIGVLGWGVGGIEAEAVMLGQPYYMLAPRVVGMKLTGKLGTGVTATDLVLTITEQLRRHGVVGKFVEFYGPGLSHLSVADRATIANMAPEYGATMGFFPVDDRTLEYLRLSARPDDLIALVEAYCKEQGLFRTDTAPDPIFTESLALDIGSVEASLAGPKRPQDRIALRRMKGSFNAALRDVYERPVKTWRNGGAQSLARRDDLYAESAVAVGNGGGFELTHGSVVIAAITSCTNTSNPSVMIGAGLLAKKAVAKGLAVKPWVKTSLAPGSKVVTEYLRSSGLLASLEALRFHVVGYGCTTCIGNSGPLAEPVAAAVQSGKLVAASVLSGNRNFEGRVNPHTLANYLASPPLVVAYALAGTVDIDMENEPIGTDGSGEPVYLRDIWPSADEVQKVLTQNLGPAMFEEGYGDVFSGDQRWRALPVPAGEIYGWEESSTYIKAPPFFETMTAELPELGDIEGARVLALLGDSVTTDHISPAGAIPADGPAGTYLIGAGVSKAEFNSFGARRGNHEVMMRGTFGNIRLRNQLVPGVEGGFTRYFPGDEKMTIYDAAMRYQREGTALVVLAGKEYGTGSSRDWAAKGTGLLGVRAVVAVSFERIHRSNLVGMGVLPLEFLPGDSPQSLGLTGEEVFEIRGIGDLSPRCELRARAVRKGAEAIDFGLLARIDSRVEVDYYRNGGILHAVLRRMSALS
jgi:aconitate hydratase